jgi:hypothetical protein
VCTVRFYERETNFCYFGQKTLQTLLGLGTEIASNLDKRLNRVIQVLLGVRGRDLNADTGL